VGWLQQDLDLLQAAMGDAAWQAALELLAVVVAFFAAPAVAFFGIRSAAEAERPTLDMR
jgi:hypothetical protein